ncbi:hypothetical protein JCGZ_01696 [Jatropha curcas]|uniref:Uncharacterized protein n=1 Tax=Jatropha curcas TaxID=180498 RepID=A0A067JGM3_JATCU|nr:hypothetical protein JCGZ_01696 [Jatropha curcas]
MARAKPRASRNSNLSNRNLLQSIDEEASVDLNEAKKDLQLGKEIGMQFEGPDSVMVQGFVEMRRQGRK